MDINAFSIKVTAEPNCEVRTMKMTTCSNQGQNWTGKEYKIVPKHDEKPIETPRGFVPPAGYTPPEGYEVGLQSLLSNAGVCCSGHCFDFN